MSKKESIEARVKLLNEKEEQIKIRLTQEADQAKSSRAFRIGKIALITGGVALVGYWIFNVIFQHEDEEQPKKKSKRKKSSNSTGLLTALLLPYLQKILEGYFDKETGKSVNLDKE